MGEVVKTFKNKFGYSFDEALKEYKHNCGTPAYAPDVDMADVNDFEIHCGQSSNNAAKRKDRKLKSEMEMVVYKLMSLYEWDMELLRKNSHEEYLFDILHRVFKTARMSLETKKILPLLEPYLSKGYERCCEIYASGYAEENFKIWCIKNIAYANEIIKLFQVIEVRVRSNNLGREGSQVVDKFTNRKRAQLENLIAEANSLLNKMIAQIESQGKERTDEQSYNDENSIRENFNKFFSLKSEIKEFTYNELDRLIDLAKINEKQKQLEISKDLPKAKSPPVKKAQRKAVSAEPLPKRVVSVGAAAAALPKAPVCLDKTLGSVKTLAGALEEYQDLLAYKLQKQRELAAYKENIKQERALKVSLHQERTRILMASTDFELEEKEDKELSEIHMERLQYLMKNLNKSHRTTIAKIFKCPDFAEESISRKDRPKFAEVECLIKALQGTILEDAHFGFLVPNIRKEWDPEEEGPNGSYGYKLTRKSMGRYVSCHPHGKQHNSDELSALAVACIKSGLEKSGISPETINKLKSYKKIKP